MIVAESLLAASFGHQRRGIFGMSIMRRAENPAGAANSNAAMSRSGAAAIMRWRYYVHWPMIFASVAIQHFSFDAVGKYSAHAHAVHPFRLFDDGFVPLLPAPQADIQMDVNIPVV